MNRYTTAGLAAALLAGMAATGKEAAAQAPTVSDIFSVRQQSSANSSNFATGDALFWGANNVVPAETSWGFTRQCPIGATCLNNIDPPMVRQALFWRPFELTPNSYFASRPYDPALTGPWQIIVSSQPNFPPDPAFSTLVSTPAVGDAALMPFVQSMSVSGAGLTPTISWTLPAAPIDQVRLFIFDNSNPVTTTSRSPNLDRSFQQGNLIYVSDPLSTAQTTLQVSEAAGLTYGTHYSIAIGLEHRRPGAVGDQSPALDSRSLSYFEFTPLDMGDAEVYLPTTTPIPTTSGEVAGPVYSFSEVPASPDTVTFIDPFVATGFDYAVGAGDPNFRSVLLPDDVGDGFYDLFTWDGTDYVDTELDLAGGVEFSFLALNGSGLERFSIRGIETEAEVNPFDLTAFVTGLTFMEAGTFNGTMTPIIVEVNPVPEPETYALMLAGLALLGFTARRRKMGTYPI